MSKKTLGEWLEEKELLDPQEQADLVEAAITTAVIFTYLGWAATAVALCINKWYFLGGGLLVGWLFVLVTFLIWMEL